MFHYLAKNDNQRKNLRKTTILLAPVAKYFLTSSQATATVCVQEGEAATAKKDICVFSNSIDRDISQTHTARWHSVSRCWDLSVHYLPWNTAHLIFFSPTFHFLFITMQWWVDLQLKTVVFLFFLLFNLTLQFAQYYALSNTHVWDGGEVDIQVQEQAAAWHSYSLIISRPILNIVSFQ